MTPAGKWRNGFCLCLDSNSTHVIQSECKEAEKFTLLPKNPKATKESCGKSSHLFRKFFPGHKPGFYKTRGCMELGVLEQRSKWILWMGAYTSPLALDAYANAACTAHPQSER